MKYLKLFNENDFYQVDFVDYCRSHIPYLIDKGFDIHCSTGSSGVITFNLYKIDGKWFKWEDIKDEFISLLLLINHSYTFKPFYEHIIFNEKTIRFHGIDFLYTSIKDIDNVPDDFNSHIIAFKIKRES